MSTAVDLVDKDDSKQCSVEKKVNRNRENDVEFNYTAPSFPVTKRKGDGNVLSDPHALQLVIGKTMREELGEEVAVAFCKNIKCGQLVLVTGRLGEYNCVLHCVTLSCIELCCTALHSTVLFNIEIHFTSCSDCSTLYCTELYRIVPHFILYQNPIHRKI